MSGSAGASGSASGGQLEEKIDLSAETDAKLAQSAQLVSAGQLRDALGLLAALEKRCRTLNDSPSLVRVCEASLVYCHQSNDCDALISTLHTLVTRRSQKTAAIQAMVRLAVPWCVQAPYAPVPVTTDEEKKNRQLLTEALREITDGRIFLEKERAQLTRALATIKEEEGDVAAAADVLQDVHVETFGSLSKKDKIEFILEQMRLTLAKRDFVRAAIVAGKVSRKNLREENMEEYKVRFFTLLTIAHRHDKDALELARDFHAIYDTSSVLADESKRNVALQSTVLFLALSPYGNEQQDMLHRLSTDTNLDKLPECQATIQLFLKKEIINYPMAHQTDMEAMQAFQEGGPELSQYWHELFHTRIIQHNIRVVSKYYTRIHGSRLAQLFQLSPERLEKEISSMVSDGGIYARIDRPADIVRFAAPQAAEEILSDWAGDIDKLLHLVETTTHLIHKEKMIAQ